MKNIRFEKFLINRGVFEKFMCNFINDNTLIEYKDYQKLYRDSRFAIELAFRWYTTPEGGSFWSEIDYEWKLSLNNNTL